MAFHQWSVDDAPLLLSSVSHAKALGEGCKSRNDQVASPSTLVHVRSLQLALLELQTKRDGQIPIYLSTA